VLEGFKEVRLVTWDAVVRLGLPWSDYDGWLRDRASAVACFLEAVGRIGMAHDQKSDTKWLVCDPMAVAVSICDQLVTASEVRFFCANPKPYTLG
jgi:hypothetical protein